MKSNECIILIPLYKTYLYDYEEISLKRCIDVLGKKYKFFFMMPNNIDIYQLFEKYNIQLNFNEDFDYIMYDSGWFSSVETFNNLLLKSDIYNQLQLIEYKYTLFYELDAFIFYDNLQYWVDKHYDFVGSFSFKYNNVLLPNIKNKDTTYIMNGGVSLRNIQYCINRLKDAYGWEWYGDRWEDRILCKNANIKAPQIIETFDFAWSYNYNTSYMMNNGKLPMCVHYYQYNRHMFNICKKYYENNIITNEIIDDLNIL